MGKTIKIIFVVTFLILYSESVFAADFQDYYVNEYQ